MADCSENYEHEILNGHNTRNVICKNCNSVILTPSTASFISFELELPLIEQKLNNSNPETEKVSLFWTVNDLCIFENIGFSYVIGNNRYLVCSDCETGPIGYYDISSKKSYIALSRVEHSLYQNHENNSTMPDCSENYEHEILNGRNTRNVICKYCNSVILTPSTASFISFEFDLPLIKQKLNESNPETEKVSLFWTVNDMFIFQNIGFSYAVGNNKYLACADCEAGPIGYHDISSKKSYVALSRVQHS